MDRIFLKIAGDAIAKKNSQVAISMGKRNMIIPSKAYQKWAKRVTPYLLSLNLKYTGTYPCVMSVYHKRRTLRAFDLSNMFEGVQDVLQAVGVIKEDNMLHLIPHIMGKGWEKDKEENFIYIIIQSYADFCENCDCLLSDIFNEQ